MKKYWELFFVFFKLGAFTFGGGYTMVPLIRNEVVEKRRWIEDEEFMDALSIALSAPGPIALNTALFVGNRRLGFKGSLFSAAGVILPSFLIILFIAIVLTQFKDNAAIERIFRGIRPAVVALIAAPLFSLGKSAGVHPRNIWVPAVVTFAVWWLGVSPVYIVLIALAIGVGKGNVERLRQRNKHLQK
jgi:chromate transporter